MVDQTRWTRPRYTAPYTAVWLGGVQYQWREQDYSASPTTDLPSLTVAGGKSNSLHRSVCLPSRARVLVTTFWSQNGPCCAGVFGSPAPTGVSPGPITWTRPVLCRCLWHPRLPPESRLVLSRGLVPSRAGTWLLMGSRLVLSRGPVPVRIGTWLLPGIRRTGTVSCRGLVWSSPWTRSNSCRCSWLPRLPPESRLILSRGLVPACSGTGSCRWLVWSLPWTRPDSYLCL